MRSADLNPNPKAIVSRTLHARLATMVQIPKLNSVQLARKHDHWCCLERGLPRRLACICPWDWRFTLSTSPGGYSSAGSHVGTQGTRTRDLPLTVLYLRRRLYSHTTSFSSLCCPLAEPPGKSHDVDSDRTPGTVQMDGDL